MSEKLEVVDVDGKKYEITVMDPPEILDLLEACGEASTNRGYLHYAMAICSVTAIDGVPVLRPRNKADLKRLGGDVGNKGLAAVNAKLFGGPGDGEVSVEAQAKN